jgi:uncharacterized damage-inducible protein DinB
MQKEKLVADINYAFNEVEKFLASASEEELNARKPGKWSRKEVLGHLIDSALNNIKRFTEIQFKEKPYAVIGYAQDELVIANGYQTQQFAELFYIWKALNTQVIQLMNIQTEESLNYKVLITSTNEIKTLNWLMEDYVAHLLHHLKQINEQKR